MEIIYRNFMRLMAAGAFSNETTVEPMSRFKWNQLLRLAATYGVEDYVSAGIISYSAKNGPCVQKDILERVYADYSKPENKFPYAMADFDFTKNTDGRFADFRLRRRLRNIVHNEIHSIDTSTATLALLFMLIDNVNGMIYGDIDFRLTIALGQYLRTDGDHIDFVKTEQWLRALGIRRPVNIIGSYLTVLFGFDEKEVQFMSKTDRSAAERAVRPLKFTLERASRETDIRDYNDKMKTRRHIPDSRILSRVTLFPAEVTGKFITGVARSLSNIEE